MRRLVLRSTIVAALAVIVSAAAFARLGVRSGRVVCVVENETSQVVDVGVGIYEREYWARGLSPGGSFSFEFEPGADAQYEVEATLGSGARYTQELGYVTSGVNVHHRVSLGDKAATLTATLD